jgi:Cdc6-like AAA superfamily ATPase
VADRWTKIQLNSFQDAAQSLKKYSRADLRNETNGVSLIEELYVDPLPNEHILQTMLKANTTILIGRKGTGKSTIFQRVQHELRKRPNYASAYIDIKTVYELSRADSTIMAKIDVNSGALSKESLEKLQLYRAFLRTIIKQIHDQLKERVQSTPLERIKRFFSGTIDELFKDLDTLLEDISKNRYSSITGIKTVTAHDTSGLSTEVGKEGTASISLGPKPELSASLTAKDAETVTLGREQTYADTLILEFSITAFLSRLKELLDRISIRHLYIFIDDFSELPEDAMKVVVDNLLAPLNNWSEELIKFKIAAYPGRIYYGAIDKTKIDEINLDFYKLYADKKLAIMEEKAIDFTFRLITSRLRYYCNSDANVFIEVKNDDIWRFFFYASMANPRNLGYILFYLHESHLIYNRPINLLALRKAAQRYYEEKIEPYFKMNKFLQESFDERSSVLSLRELLEDIIKKARVLRFHKSSEIVPDTRRKISPTVKYGKKVGKNPV